MEVCLQKGGPVIGSPATIMDDRRTRCQAAWEQRLRQNPSDFRRVEREIKRHFDQGADQFTAAVLARAHKRERGSGLVSEKSPDPFFMPLTRSDPAANISGIDSFIEQKHWGCRGALLIDARIKPHHAPPLLEDPAITHRVDAVAVRGGPLAQYL